LREAFVNVDGLKIRYLESADNAVRDDNTKSHSISDKRHVLFIHGLGSSSDRWLDIPDALSLSGLHTVAVDLPGFGGSDRPANMDYTIENFAKVIIRFMHETRIDDGRTCIVGHSLGGYIAAELAIENRPLVGRLVLVDSSGMLDGPTPLLEQYLDAAMNPSKQSVRSVFEQLVANPVRIPEVLVNGFIYRISQPNAKHAFRSAFYNSTKTRLGTDRLRKINDGGIPVLIMWGSEDRLIPLDYYQTFKRELKNAESVVINDAGHAPFAEKPALACQILHRFLSD
jgi:pimeloyl-ACP methyl ester carboxylesterase